MSVFKKWILPALLAGVLLAGCGGDGTSGDDPITQAVMGNGQPANGAQAEMQAPAPQVQQVEVTRIVKDVQRVEVPVETVREVVKEVPVVQYVEVTAQPDVQGFAAPAQSAGGECNTYIALPVTVDDDGTIHGEYLMCAWETAVALSGGK